jgi:hypothetical protein
LCIFQMFALLLSLVKDKLRWPVETFRLLPNHSDWALNLYPFANGQVEMASELLCFSDGRSSEADADQLSESFTLLWLPKLLCM